MMFDSWPLGRGKTTANALKRAIASRRRWSQTAAGVTCLAMLGLPLLYPLTRDRERTYLQTVEQRQPTEFPDRPSWRDWFYRGTYRQLNQFLADRLPLRSTFIQTKGSLERSIFEQTRNGNVDTGEGGWLYYRSSYGLNDGPDGDRYTIERVDYALESLRRYLAWQDRTPSTVRIAIAPSKHEIYPEFLPAIARRDLQKTQPSRDRLRTAIVNSNDPRLLDLWSTYRAAKPALPQRIYYKEDTHHSPRGALVLVEAIVKALDPQVFAPSNVKPKLDKRVRTGDLLRMMGLDVKFTDENDPVFAIERPGIAEAGVDTDTGRWPTVADAIARDGMISDPKRRFVVNYRSGGAPLIPGRTLVVGDSFMPQLALGQFFESAEFYHHDVIPQTLLMAASLTYDHIILERVDRLALSFLETLPRLGDPLGWWRSAATPTLWRATPEQPAGVEPVGNTQLERQGDRWIVTGEPRDGGGGGGGNGTDAQDASPPRLALPVPTVEPGKTYVMRLSLVADAPGQAQLFYATATRRGDASPLIRVNFAKGYGELFFLVQASNLQPEWELTWNEGTDRVVVRAIELRELP